MNYYTDSLKYSKLFDGSSRYVADFEQWLENFINLSSVNVHRILAVVIFIFLIICIIYVLWFTAQKFFTQKGRKSRSLRNRIFVGLVLACFCSGVLVYFYGYDYAGTSKNVVVLLLRSVLSSFEMFLSKSNLIGIAENCKSSSTYMMLFAIVHASAMALSTSFVVACFWKRIKYWCKSVNWIWGNTNDKIYVFWGGK